ncbi:MAG: elongation factor Ts [Alphaproteobacteria bacterium]|nr:elongation factor Ts [Alphaproteobacteria bacterium]
MAEITASMVKELRESTGAGMMDAKKALVENNGDMENAIDWLRTKGLAKAAKKSGRTAAEGLVAIATEGTKGAVVEVNSETDFVARNAEFQTLVTKIAQKALNTSTVEELATAQIDGKDVATTLTDLIAKIGENMALRRMTSLSVPQGSVVGYVHGALADGLGKIGVLVALESSADNETLQALGKQIAMHVAAANPQFLGASDVSSDVLDRERSVLKEQAIASGKPADIAEKMVEGRIRKFYEEICLLEQVFVIDNETKISQVVANAAKQAGADIKLTGFARVQLGEGIEKEETDFAAEVAAAVNG